MFRWLLILHICGRKRIGGSHVESVTCGWVWLGSWDGVCKGYSLGAGLMTGWSVF